MKIGCQRLAWIWLLDLATISFTAQTHFSTSYEYFVTYFRQNKRRVGGRERRERERDGKVLYRRVELVWL
jgi:hypothetical protein